MKSVVVIGPAYPLRGGIAAYTQRLAQEFVKQNYQTTVYTFSLQYPSFLFPGKTQFSSDQPPADLSIKVAINSINPFNWIKIGKEIRKLNPQLVIFNYWLPLMAPCYGTIARIIRKNKTTACLAVIHNMIPHEKRMGDKPFSKYFIQSCSGYVTMTKQVDKDLEVFTSSQNKLIVPHPVYDTYGNSVSKVEASKYLNVDAADKYLLFFGLVRRYKGLDILLHALADERVRKLNIRLLVAGEFYEERSYYDDLIQNLDIYNKVVIKSDFIPDEEVKYYFSIADLIILPYRNATQSGVSSLAIHFDKPMIVSNFGGLPDTVVNGETGFVTEADAISIADAIVTYYTKVDQEAMKKQVEKEKQKYSWLNVVNALEQLNRTKSKL
ncbi:MAG: glycosyltransferase [Bacteroidota bacterium]